MTARIMHGRRPGWALTGIGVLLGCSAWATVTTPAGDAETDRVAQTVALAVAHPHVTTPEQALNAVLDTRAARTGGLVVVEAERLPATATGDPMVRMTWRIRHEQPLGPWSSRPTPEVVSGCYEVALGFHGAAREPLRVHCPPSETAVTALPGDPLPLPVFPPMPENPLSPTN